MPKPTLPTQQEMRDFARVTYGHYSNLSREWLQLVVSAPDRVLTYGYEKVDRTMAELWEAEYLALSVIDQETLIDWYIDHYRGAMNRKAHGGTVEFVRDQNNEGPAYGLAGFSIGWWTPDTCVGRKCKVQLINETPGGPVTEWVDTLRRCSAHNLIEQGLVDTIFGENGRKNAMLNVVEGIISVETKDDATTWSFTNDRIGATDERVLTMQISGTTNPQRSNVQDAADVQFGVGAVLVT